MIIDKIKNISIYTQIPDEAIKFINALNCSTPSGKYVISDSVYANIEEYNTKKFADAKFESHKKYIDIQFLLSGNERIFYSDIHILHEDIKYDPDRDIMFYKENIEKFNNILLDGSNFIMLYPHEAHAPQVSIGNKPEQVKKVVVKIKI